MKVREVGILGEFHAVDSIQAQPHQHRPFHGLHLGWREAIERGVVLQVLAVFVGVALGIGFEDPHHPPIARLHGLVWPDNRGAVGR